MEQPDVEQMHIDNNLEEIKERYGYTDDIRDIKSYDKEQLLSIILSLYDDLKDLKKSSDTNNEALDLLTSIKIRLDDMKYDITDIRYSTSKINDIDDKLNLEDIKLFSKISDYYNFHADLDHITKRSLFKILKEAYYTAIKKDKLYQPDQPDKGKSTSIRDWHWL